MAFSRREGMSVHPKMGKMKTTLTYIQVYQVPKHHYTAFTFTDSAVSLVFRECKVLTEHHGYYMLNLEP